MIYIYKTKSIWNIYNYLCYTSKYVFDSGGLPFSLGFNEPQILGLQFYTFKKMVEFSTIGSWVVHFKLVSSFPLAI